PFYCLYRWRLLILTLFPYTTLFRSLFRDITIEDVRTALASFVPSSSQTPGRLNFFNFRNFTVLADFAHNPHGLRLLCDFVNKLEYPLKVSVIYGTDERRDQDLQELGEISAGSTDAIIIRCDKNLPGRTADEIINLLKTGIEKVNPDLPVMVIPDENKALEYIYANHKPGALYTIMCDVVAGAMKKLKELKEREESDVIIG